MVGPVLDDDSTLGQHDDAPRTISAVEQAYDALATFVRTAPAGTPLPPERELAIRFGVSRTTLRSAVDRLALLGYVQVRHGSGSVVAKPTAADLAVPFQAALQDVRGSVQDVFALRQILEPALAASAAKDHRLEHTSTMRAAQDGSDADFHQLIARLSGNALAAQVVGVLIGMTRSREGPADHHDSRRVRVTAHQHRAVVDAITDGDDELARETMALHLRWETRQFTASRD